VAEEASRIVFDRKADPAAITDEVYATLAREIPSALVNADGAPPAMDVLGVLETAFGQSRSAGRKLLQQGAVTVNGARLGASDVTVALDRAVRGRWFLVRKGARDVAVAEVARDA
jgi:tyrosyl-tRNA synthetase